jgi:hypothetical protein
MGFTAHRAPAGLRPGGGGVMRRLALTAAAAAVLIAPASADAARMSTARAQIEAARAVSQPVKSVLCFRVVPRTRRQAKVDRHVCVVFSPARPGDQCVTTVGVSKRVRSRRIRTRVIVPFRCFPEWPAIGSRDAL